jgi:UDP-glucose 4-epimerase
MDMNLLVTGATGFIGRHLLRHLARRHPELIVFGVGRDRARLDRCGRLHAAFVPVLAELDEASAPSDIERQLDGRRVDRVIHLASWVATPREDLDGWERLLRSNSLGTIHLWRWIERRPVEDRPDAVISTSSITVYGDPLVQPADEDSPTLPTTFYGLSKLGGELYGAYFAKALGPALVDLRLGYVYGPDDESPKAIYHFIARSRTGAPITITTSPLVYRDYVFVGDVCRVLAQLAIGPPPSSQLINFSAGRGVSLLELARCIQRGTGFQSPIRIAPGRGDFLSGCTVQTVERARQLVGRFTSIDEGVAMTIAGETNPEETNNDC